MAVRLIVAPPATGKTTLCIERVRDVLEHKPLAPVWVVLPDRLQKTYFRRRLAEAGGAIGAHVGTFHDVYRHVLETAGTPVPVASGPVMREVVGAAIEDVRKNRQLVHYGEIARMPGFRNVAADRIAELKRARIEPADFAEHVAGNVTLSELGLVYEAYQSRLLDLDWADEEGLSWLAVRELDADPLLAEPWALVVVDGFDHFIEAQRGFLAALGRTDTDVVVTLPGQPGGGRKSHRRFSTAIVDLGRELGIEPEALSREPRLPSAAAHLESQLFESSPRRRSLTPDLELKELRAPADEAREALRWIKARHVRDGIDLDSCAIITPDPERYRPFLVEAATEMALPLAFLYGERLSSAPSIVALLDLLKLPVHGFPRRLTLEAVRTPYFDLHEYELAHRDADALDAVSREAQVVEGLAQWVEALDMLAARTDKSDQNDEDGTARRSVPAADEATRLAKAMGLLGDALLPGGEVPPRRSLTLWVAWLEDLLARLKYPNLVPGAESSPTDADTAADAPGASRDARTGPVETYRRDRSALSALRESLRAIAMSEELGIGHPVDYAAFVAELTGALDSASFAARQDRETRYVTVTGVLDARGPRFDAVAMVGLSEGVFPQVEREDPFLDEATRAALGLEMKLDREQRGLFYLAATRADKHLLLTRPYLADDGQDREASPYWRAVCLLFDPPADGRHPGGSGPHGTTKHERDRKPCDGLVSRLQGDEPRPVVDAASYEELLVWSVRRSRLPVTAHATLEPRWNTLRHARDVLAARSASKPKGPLEGELASESAAFAQRYGPDHVWSPSRLEVFGSCPLRFLIESVMKLEPDAPPEPGMDAMQLGTMLHHILEVAFDRASDPTDPESVLEELHVAADREFADAPEAYGFRQTVLWDVEQAEYRRWLDATVRALAELEGNWRPHAMEAAFGMKGNPPVEVDTTAGSIKVRGLVDRIDRDDAGRVRVLDYKTGASHLNKADLVNGTRLQLPLYAMAARDALGMGAPTEGLYWAIRAAKAGSLRLSKFKHEIDGRSYSGPTGAMQVMAEHVGRYVELVRIARFNPTPNKGECPEYCSAAGWCWRFRPKRW